MTDFDDYLEAGEPAARERAYAWSTAIGLQDVDGLKPSQNGVPKSDQKSRQKSDQKIVGILRRNPNATIAGLVAETGLSPSGVKKVVRYLKETGRLRRVGPDKGGHWEVVTI